ncbi:MAG: hypothetical protein HY866_02805 [Chloroflexi bacterium]|nr:hypothetical protein [Chloroflexota bacterium]
MDNLMVLCCISALIGLLILFIILRSLRNLFGGQSTQANGSQPGSIEPTYDDPNIQGQGSFGKRGIFGNIRPTHNDPKIQGQGSFGRVLSGLPGRRSSKSDSGQSGRVDSDSVQGQGSFGRDKKD